VAGVPFFHVSGCVLGNLGMLVSGGTYIPLITFDPVKNLELISSERATICFGVPTMLLAMLNHPRFLAGEFDTSSLRIVGTGGSPVPVPVMEQVQSKMGADVLIVFGMTEGSGVMTQTRLQDSFELKSSTVGLPLPHTEARIIHPATGEPVGFGQPGELLMRGFLVMKGYYQMPEKTAQAIDAQGWLHSGDLATMNAQGYLNIVGRLKDMIIRGGENLSPAEIEQFLMRHPKVAEAQVVGVPDPFMVEEVVALLKLKPGETCSEEEIRQYCQGAISRNKIPRYIRFVSDYPLTSSGKVKKFELRAQMIEILGLQELAKTRMA
jgi:fatty-acyl-CoA synthase